MRLAKPVFVLEAIRDTQAVPVGGGVFKVVRAGRVFELGGVGRRTIDRNRAMVEGLCAHGRPWPGPPDSALRAVGAQISPNRRPRHKTAPRPRESQQSS
jgi:hypothetical protein